MEFVIGSQQPHCWLSIPEAKALNLVFFLEMRKADFQHRVRAVLIRCGSDPRAAFVNGAERTADGQ